MKKVFLSALLFLLLPTLCPAAFIIHLKNGSAFKTTSYWKEGQSVKFIYKGGELGLDKHLISSIEHTEEVFMEAEPGPQEILPIKPIIQENNVGKKGVTPEKKKSARKKSRKIKSLQKRFRYLEDQFGKIQSMSTKKAISLVKKLMNFRDVALKERLGSEFEKEIQEVYSMGDAIETELKSRNN